MHAGKMLKSIIGVIPSKEDLWRSTYESITWLVSRLLFLIIFGVLANWAGIIIASAISEGMRHRMVVERVMAETEKKMDRLNAVRDTSTDLISRFRTCSSLISQQAPDWRAFSAQVDLLELALVDYRAAIGSRDGLNDPSFVDLLQQYERVSSRSLQRMQSFLGDQEADFDVLQVLEGMHSNVHPNLLRMIDVQESQILVSI